ncbi:hypothetical protein RDWZM_001489 [Blomia tropicalis]|uniref:BCL-6 corepressor n=1 Tax=Blomia tropicalis TaxID=40697 RepID=A0A9Q0MC18_BLOTA|nr:hypothetical protein RDWZM_001489 [Blomia tropicalis]
MYYPGLFESATPFPGLNPHPFKTDSLPPSAGEQHVDLITLTDKKMAGNLSTSSLASPVLTTLTSPFRGPPHFGSPHYRPQTGDLMASPYMTSSAPHLAANDNLNPSLLHEQSFLEASTPYGIGPLPSYPHYPNYMGNSVLNPTLANKGSPSTGYPPHGSSFYPSSGPSYPSLYPDSFISEYIVRNHHHHHIDSTNKAPAYNAPVSDNSSFFEHLKRLQESLEGNGKSGGQSCHVNVAANHHGQYTCHTQPVRPEATNGENNSVCPKPSVIDSNPIGSNSNGDPTHLAPCPSSFQVSTPVSQCGGNNVSNCDLSKSNRSTKLCKVETNKSVSSDDVQPQRLLSSKADKKVTKNNNSSSKNHKNKSTINGVIHEKEYNNTKDYKSREGHNSTCTSKATTTTTTTTTAVVASEHITTTAATKTVTSTTLTSSKSAKAAAVNKVKHNRKDKCDNDRDNGERRNDATGQEKIKKTCKRQLWNPDGDEHDVANDKKKDVKENEKAKPKVKAPSKNEDKTNNNNNKKMKKDTIEEIASPKETKPSKKSNGNGRRRRFRSGLDMIRSSRKKSANKTRSPAKKDNKVKKDLTAKDLRLDSKRLIVNKSLGETMLHRSARNNRLDVVKQCLLLECDVNVRDNAGYTPLHECSSRGNLEVARLLLQHSADVNASATGGIRPLHDAIENNHIELVRLLLSYGADPNISTYSGSTPLQLCRSKMMFKFLKGTRPPQSLMSLIIVNLWTTMSRESGDYVENGFDIFADVPSDGEDCENVFHFGERPIVPSYCPIHNYNSPFYLLSDVLAATGLSEAEFKRLHSNVEITKITKTDFMKATLSQLEQRLFRADSIDQDELSIIERNDTIDEILNISTTVI